MFLKNNHTPVPGYNTLSEEKQKFFLSIYNTFDSLKSDDNIPVALKNISLYLSKDYNELYEKTSFGGIYATSLFNVFVKEYVKFDDENWVVYVIIQNKPEYGSDAIVDINQENVFASINKYAIGMVDGVFMIAPENTERVIAIDSDFKNNKIMIVRSELIDFIYKLPVSSGYKIDNLETSAFLIDSPSPLFDKDTVNYRDGEYVGTWISFGTLLKFDLTNLNVFNIDGTKVGAIDSDSDSKEISCLKMLSNTAYGYATMIFSKEKLLSEIMKFSKRYIYEVNMEDETRICVDNLLENLQNKGIFGLLYDDYDIVSNYPMVAYDEKTSETHRKLSTAMRFNYKNEEIVVVLDFQNNRMYFETYAGRTSVFSNSKYNYDVKIRNDLKLSKTSYISKDNFILFTGFGNLKHNKVLDFYFDNTTESFSSLDKSFGIEVSEFDGFYKDEIRNPSENFYNNRNDFVFAYGANKFPLISGLLSYEEYFVRPNVKEYRLVTSSEPTISTIFDAENKQLLLMHPSVRTNSLFSWDDSDLKIYEFFNNYVARWENGDDVEDWVDEAIAGSYVYKSVGRFYTNGWAFKKVDGKYECVKTSPIRLQTSIVGSVDAYCEKKAKELIDYLGSAIESMSRNDYVKARDKEIAKKTKEVEDNVKTQIKSTKNLFMSRVIQKTSTSPLIIDSEYDRFEFESFEGSDNIYINNSPESQIQNHAFMFEDTYMSLMNKYKNIVKDFLGIGDNQDVVYSDYFSPNHISVNDKKIIIEIANDASSSFAMYSSKVLGLAMTDGTVTRDRKVLIGNTRMEYNEAYNFRVELFNIGPKNIDDIEMSMFEVRVFRKYSEKAKEAIESEFKGMYEKYKEEDSGIPTYDDAMQDAQKQLGVDLDIKASIPEMDAIKPMYICVSGSKIMSSLDGVSFVDMSHIEDGDELSSSLIMFDKNAFLSELETVKQYNKKKTFFDLHIEEDLKKRDSFTVGVDTIVIDTSRLLETGKVIVAAKMYVDSGQIVLGENDREFLFNAGDEFSIEKEIDIDGVDEVGENIEFLVNFNIRYYIGNITGETNYGNKDEMLLNESTIDVRLNIPMFVSIRKPYDYVFIDKDSAIDNGLKGWINFTEE